MIERKVNETGFLLSCSSMMKIGIVSNSRDQIYDLDLILTEYNKKNAADLSWNVYSSLKNSISPDENLELVFVQKEKIDEKALEQKKENGPLPFLVLILTSLDEAIQFPNLSSFYDFILDRPLIYERIATLLNEIRNKPMQENPHLNFHGAGITISESFADIEYIVSKNKKIHLKIKNKPIRTEKPVFPKIEPLLLEDDRFVEVQRGILINMDYIKENLGFAFLMKDGTEFVIRKSGQMMIQEQYQKYQMKKMALAIQF